MENYNAINIVLESFCAILCAFICAYVFTDKYRNKTRTWYGWISLATIGILLGDMCDWAFSGKPGLFMHILMTAGITLFFISSVVILYSFSGYFIQFFDEKKLVFFPHMLFITRTICSLQVLLIVLSLFNKTIFYIDENNVYHRGKCFFLGYISMSMMFFIAAGFIRNARNIKRKELLLMLYFVLLPAAGQVLQTLKYGLALIGPSATLAVITGLIFISIEDQQRENLKKSRELEELNDQLQKVSNMQEEFGEEIITVLGRSIEAKDVYTQGHSSRVANYTKEMVYRLGGDTEEQKRAYVVGLLHDIGKLRIPDGIINKDGKLTDEEYEMIKVHTIAGFHILQAVKSVPEIYEGARWHHERYDGKGYPNGLSGEEIPFLARVIAVADAYDAMTSRRSYRDTMPQEKVRAEIEKGKGTQFDPRIADVMLQMIDEDYNYDMRQINDLNNKRILLIDDDNIVHTQVKLALEGEKYMVTSVFSGEEGIRYMKEEDFDLALIDLQMSGMSGLEVVEWIFNNKRRTKCILFTGDKEMQVIRKATAMGIKDYVTKPIRPMVLKESISSVLLH